MRLHLQPGESRAATDIGHDQIMPVSHYPGDHVVKTLRPLVIQLFAKVEVEEGRESLVHLLDTLVGRSRRRRLVAQGDEDQLGFFVVGLQFQKFLVRCARLVTAPQDAE